jgi:hypothetical protein
MVFIKLFLGYAFFRLVMPYSLAEFSFGETEIPKFNTRLQSGDSQKPVTTGFNHFNGFL